jgi:hypothetical protein
MNKKLGKGVGSGEAERFNKVLPVMQGKRGVAPFVSLGPLILLATLVGRSSAEVYEWTDSRGVRHFASQKVGDEFKKAALPPLLKERSKPMAKKPEGCGGHGGISCQAGADDDGSVICFDGFRGASARFRFSCSSPKLTVTAVEAAAGAGSYKVVIRNDSGVTAEKPVITLPPELGKPTISGPESIAPLELAEFLVAGTTAAPAAPQVAVGCGNCG